MLRDIGFWREKFQELTGVSDKAGPTSTSARIAIMGENSYQFAVMFYAALALPNTLAVPLCTNHTAAEIEYQLNDSQAEIVVTPVRFLPKVEQFANEAVKTTDGAEKSRKVLTLNNSSQNQQRQSKNQSSFQIVCLAAVLATCSTLLAHLVNLRALLPLCQHLLLKPRLFLQHGNR